MPIATLQAQQDYEKIRTREAIESFSRPYLFMVLRQSTYRPDKLWMRSPAVPHWCWFPTHIWRRRRRFKAARGPAAARGLGPGWETGEGFRGRPRVPAEEVSGVHHQKPCAPFAGTNGSSASMLIRGQPHFWWSIRSLSAADTP